MPLIPPRFPNNSSSTTTTTNKPPWARGPQASSIPQSSEVPWRRNLKSVPTPVASKSPTKITPPPLEADQACPEQQPKTSKIQINLKSVKKPEPQPKAIPILIETPQLRQQQQNGNTKPEFATTIPIQIQKAKPEEIKETMLKSSEAGGPPAPPPPPPGPPPPPPPADGLNIKHIKIEQLRKAPKKRPDWAGMMKEIEKGRVLKHVDCNDRSKPIIPKLKSRGKFVFESEAKPASKSDALHNRLINEIQQGVKLKRVHCNDRSKPILTGLRVRRQSSVAEGEGSLLPMEPVDELAFLDIDVLRDELQSAKQMLQTEIESKHSLEKKTRDQKCQIIAMEAEIETLKAKLGIIPEDEVSVLARNLEKSDSKTFKHLRKSGSSLWKSPSGIKKSKSGLPKPDTDQNAATEEELTELNEYEEEIASLKDAVQHARKQAEELERKYKEASEKLQNVQNSFEESEQKRRSLEKQVEIMETEEGKKPPPPVIQTAERTTQTEEQILDRMHMQRQQSSMSNVDYDSEEEESEEDMEVDETSVQRKKQERELKLWDNKLKSIRDKQNTSRTERKNLKNLQKKLEDELKEANKRHNKLQKEVDKMAKMMDKMAKEAEKDGYDEEEEDEDEDEVEETEEEEEESEEEEEETESESEEEDNGESSEEDDENASYEDRLTLFGKRVKKRENVLNAMRKGNYLLRANIDRLKDELEEARIAYHDLEHELNSVLDET